MTARLDRVGALRAERSKLLTLVARLHDSQWEADSHAAGWTVHDVVAHLGSGCHAIFSPRAGRMLFGDDIERANDLMVDERRHWNHWAVFDEYRTWSRRVAAIAPAVSRTPLSRVPVPLSELGRFPAGLLLTGALVFDHHTHVEHDVLPALGIPSPGTDANRMGVVIEWMMAVLGNQLAAAKPPWLDRAVTLRLHGQGGGVWTISASGTVPASAEASTCIESSAAEFPAWGTKRRDWRDQNVVITGDHDYATRVLDHVNVV